MFTKYIPEMPLQAPNGVCVPPPMNIYNCFYHYSANMKQKFDINKKILRAVCFQFQKKAALISKNTVGWVLPRTVVFGTFM